MNLKKFLFVLMIITVLLFCNLQNMVFADTEINKADLKVLQPSEKHLQFKGENGWYYVSCLFVGYNYNGKTYPAYCINRELPGVEAVEGGYSVSIDKMISDAKLWRTIISGFPYKSVAELGVETEWDAYTATKQAIYSILYDRDVREMYRGADERGEKIVNAMEKMVNEGRYGTKTPQNAKIQINKIGNLKENEDEYVQEFSINCNVPVDNYVIKNCDNLPEGIYITNKDNETIKSFNGNESFYIHIPKEKLNKDINYKIELYANCETYPVFYGVAPNSELQDHAVTFSKLAGYSSNLDVNIKTNTGKIKIIKIDEETELPLEGIKFTLYSEDKKEIATVTTNKEGIAYFENLYQGKYIIKEINTKEEYELNPKEFAVEVNFEKETEITITNKLKEGRLKIIKVDKENNEIKLEGVEFELLDENMKIIEKLITDEKGEATSSKLPSYNKKYYLRETKTNENYLLNDEIMEIRLNDEEITEKIIENKKIPEPEPEPNPEPEPIPEPVPEPTPEPEPEEPVKKLPKTGV